MSCLRKWFYRCFWWLLPAKPEPKPPKRFNNGGRRYHGCGAYIGRWKGGITPPNAQSQKWERADGTTPRYGEVYSEHCPNCKMLIDPNYMRDEGMLDHEIEEETH